MTITLETICEALSGAMTDAYIRIESGYIWITRDGETVRLSLDRKRL